LFPESLLLLQAQCKWYSHVCDESRSNSAEREIRREGSEEKWSCV